jgi:hypothetical protein
MDYFKDCEFLDEGKRIYRKMLLKLHPDVSGRTAEDSERETKELIRQWHIFKSRAKERDVNDNYRSDGNVGSMDDWLSEKLREVILADLNLDIEVIGDWIWLYNVSQFDILAVTLMGFKWSERLNGWYWTNWKEYHKRRPEGTFRRKMSLDEMRDVFGANKHKDKIYLKTQEEDDNAKNN